MNELPQPPGVNPDGIDLTVPARAGERLPKSEPTSRCEEPTTEDTMYVDWDVMIENPPVRLGRSVTVKIVSGGRQLPNLPDDPRD